MANSVFVEIEFFLLILVSIVLPVSLYGYMMWKSAISRRTVLLLGVVLVVIAGANVYLLQRLNIMAKASVSLIDNQVFVSELSIALYLLPAVFAGIGVNMVSHILVSHLNDAERRYDRRQR